jgi:hypothetical protein
MYEAYFTKRLLRALTLADEARDAEERSVYLQASRYYRDLLEFPEKRDAIRHLVAIPATLWLSDEEASRVMVTDLSTGGFRTSLENRVRPGAPLALEMDGFKPIDAFAVWQDADQLGCRFVTPIHPAVIDAAIALCAIP